MEQKSSLLSVYLKLAQATDLYLNLMEIFTKLIVGNDGAFSWKRVDIRLDKQKYGIIFFKTSFDNCSLITTFQQKVSV
jgi:hypothetical protein